MLDKNQKQILEIFSRSARFSNAQIADMLGETEEAVAAAIAGLEANGFIKGYGAIVDWDAVDSQHVNALIELKVTPKRDEGFDSIARTITEFPEVEGCYLMSGGYDLAVFLTGSSFKDVALFVAQRLAPLDSVQSTATHFVLRKYKESGVVLSGSPRDLREVMKL